MGRGVDLREGGKFRNSWRLTKACFKVLWKNPGLMVYPFFAFITSVWILVGFIGYSYGMDAWVKDTEGSRLALLMMIILGSLFTYFLMALVAIFSNAAIIGASGMLLEGKRSSVGEGYNIALSRSWALIAWASITSVVTFISSLGRFVMTAVGIAWSVLTYFVVPVIVFEKVGPFKAIKRSKDILKNNWGESLVTNFGIWTSAVLIYALILLLLLVISLYFFTMGAIPLVVYLLFMILLVTIFFGLVTYTLKGILMASLYWYSVTGEPGFDIPEGSLKMLFKKR